MFVAHSNFIRNDYYKTTTPVDDDCVRDVGAYGNACVPGQPKLQLEVVKMTVQINMGLNHLRTVASVAHVRTSEYGLGQVFVFVRLTYTLVAPTNIAYLHTSRSLAGCSRLSKSHI